MTLIPQIRPYHPYDVEAVYQAVVESKSELMPWMPWCHEHYSRSDTVEWVTKRQEAWENNVDWSFAIVDASGRILGGTGLHRLDLRNGVGEIGYWIRTSATRQGVAVAAVGLVCEWAFRERGLRRIELMAAVENRPSRSVAVRAGFTQEGILRERLLIRGQPCDAVLFAKLLTTTTTDAG